MKNQASEKHIVITIPNILSFFRLCLIPIIIWLFCVEDNYIWAGYVIILSGLTDIADGFIARSFNMTSSLGKVLDPIADKFTQAAVMICLVLKFPLMMIPIALMLIKETFMSVTGFMIIQKTGSVYGANWHGKVATILLYAMMILHVFWVDINQTVSVILIIASAVMIIVSFILYGIRNIRMLKG